MSVVSLEIRRREPIRSPPAPQSSCAKMGTPRISYAENIVDPYPLTLLTPRNPVNHVASVCTSKSILKLNPASRPGHNPHTHIRQRTWSTPGLCMTVSFEDGRLVVWRGSVLPCGLCFKPSAEKNNGIPYSTKVIRHTP